MNSGKNIPGYTGFIPYKSEFFGNTTCYANRAAETVYRSANQPTAYGSQPRFSSTGQSIVDI